MIKNMVNRIMSKGAFKWRIQHGKTSKSFMERLANLNATKVRRSIIPKVRKKLKGHSSEEERKKRKRAPKENMHIFDPAIHVKKEKCDDESTMNTSIELESNEHDVSTLTDVENCGTLVQKIKTFFETGNVMTEDAFNDLIMNKAVSDVVEPYTSSVSTHPEEPIFDGKALESPDTPMPVLPDVTSPCNNTDGDSIDAETELQENTEDKVGNNNCIGNCKYELYTNQNPYQTTLDKEYGTDIKCIKDNCGRSLLRCLKHTNGGGGAYLCKKCKGGNCKNMYCLSCYLVNGNENGRTTRTRKSRSI